MSGSSGRAGVLLDVDGTLVDTTYLHALAWSRALADAGEWAPMNAIHRLVGMGGDQLLTHLLGRDSPQARAARPGRYRELIGDARVFPGARELVRRLHDAGVAVVLATSSPKDELEVLRGLLDVDDQLDAVTTADDVPSSKPEPDVFLAAIEAGSLDRDRVLAVGDSVWDVAAARAAGIGCVGVEAGGFSRHELAEAGAVFVYHDVDELQRQLFTGALSPLL